MSQWWQGGSTRAWRKIRARVLHRDGYQCQLRLAGCTRTAPLRGGHVHHTHGKKYGDDPRFLVAACRNCNLKLGNPDRTTDPPNRTVTKW